MNGLHPKFSLRALLLGIAIVACVAAAAHYLLHYEAREIVIDVPDHKGIAYVDDRELGETPIRLSVRELIAICGGEAKVSVSGTSLNFAHYEFGTIVEGVQRSDKSRPFIWIAAQPGYRDINTPFGRAALGSHSGMHVWVPGKTTARIETRLRRPREDECELQIQPSQTGDGYDVKLVVPTEFEESLVDANVLVKIDCYSISGGKVSTVEKSLAWAEWRGDESALWASVTLPCLEAGFYFITGTVLDTGRKSFSTGSKPLVIIPTTLKVHNAIKPKDVDVRK